MNKKVIAISSVAALLLGSSAVFAHEAAIDGDIAVEGDAATGLANAGGNAIRTGLGECLQLGGYSEENTNPGCEGQEGEEPEPEAKAEPAPEPEPKPAEPIVSVATLGGKALFDTNADTLNGAGEQALADLQLEKYQEITDMFVTGHTDSRGSEAYNQGLSERRASTVAAYLEAAYPDVSITSQGMGETVPRETNSTAEGRQANRRVEIVVTAKSVTQN